MKKVLTVGGACEDIFLEYKNIEMLQLNREGERKSFIILEEGCKALIDNLDYYTGGGATNSAVSFAQLEFDVSSFFKIGTDAEGNFILDNLSKHNIDLSHVIKDPKRSTAVSFIIPTPTGDRSLLVFRGANKFLQEDEIPQKILDQTDVVYITSLPGDSSKLLPIIAKTAKHHKCLVANNPGSSQLKNGADDVRDALPYIDVFILNSSETKYCMISMAQHDKDLKKRLIDIEPFKAVPSLPLLLRSSLVHQGIYYTLRTYFKAILERGPKIIVVTNGAEGVYVATKKEIIFHPSLPTKVINTLGAGDAFGSAFVAALVDGLPLEDALRAGIINSTSVVSYLDTKTGLLTKENIKKELAKIDKKLLQRFPL